MRISDWSSDVCSSDLVADAELADLLLLWHNDEIHALTRDQVQCTFNASVDLSRRLYKLKCTPSSATRICPARQGRALWRSEEHTSELQSLMRISYAVFCLKKKKYTQRQYTNTT